MGWALLLIGLLFAPIVWAEGVSAYGSLIKHQSTDWQGPRGGGSG